MEKIGADSLLLAGNRYIWLIKRERRRLSAYVREAGSHKGGQIAYARDLIREKSVVASKADFYDARRAFIASKGRAFSGGDIFPQPLPEEIPPHVRALRKTTAGDRNRPIQRK